MKVDAYASRRHYADHMRPIWQALPPELRGTFYGVAGVSLPRRWRHDGPVMVAGWCDVVKMQPRPFVYVEHGAGQAYVDVPDDPSWSGGRGFERAVLFICPSETVAARWRARYDAPAVAVGCPKLDRWHATMTPPGQAAGQSAEASPRRTREAAVTWERELPEANPAATAPSAAESGSTAMWEGTGALTPPPRPVIAVTFHHDECRYVPETVSAWPHYDAVLPDLARAFDVLGHGHPRLWPALERRWLELGVEPVDDLADVFDRADTLVADNTSAMWEFASLGRPIVILDAPWYRRDVEHGLRFWRHANAGVRVGKPELLLGAVSAALRSDSLWRDRREAASREVYAFTDGHASERAATAIIERMEAGMPNPKAPRISRSSSERQSPLDALTERLRALGANDEEVAEFREEWLDVAKDPTPEEREAMQRIATIDDDTLRRMLVASRGEVPDDERQDEELDQAPGATVTGADPLEETMLYMGPVRPDTVKGTEPPLFTAQEPAAPSEAESAAQPAGADAEGAAATGGAVPPQQDAVSLANLLGQNVPTILDHVGEDGKLARLVLDEEHRVAKAEDRAPRATLVGPLTKIADW